jgi:hypothetical protein
MGFNAIELLELMEEVLDGDEEFEEGCASDEEDDEEEWDDEEEDDEEANEEDQDEAMVAAHRSMRGGKMVLIKAHKKHKMSSKQKMALNKNRKLAFKSGAMKKRAKSLSKGRSKGLY